MKGWGLCCKLVGKLYPSSHGWHWFFPPRWSLGLPLGFSRSVPSTARWFLASSVGFSSFPGNPFGDSTTVWFNLFSNWRYRYLLFHCHSTEIQPEYNSIYYVTRWFQTCFYFYPHLGKIINLTNIFQMGWFNHQPGKERYITYFKFFS